MSLFTIEAGNVTNGHTYTPFPFMVNTSIVLTVNSARCTCTSKYCLFLLFYHTMISSGHRLAAAAVIPSTAVNIVMTPTPTRIPASTLKSDPTTLLKCSMLVKT